MKKIISIAIKTIVIILLIKMLQGITSIPLDPDLDSNFPNKESMQSAKLFLKILALGFIFGVI